MVTGVIITLGGIAMLALPGPAFVVIPIGLAMLAMEFAWAEHALEKALDQADKAQQKAREASKLQKVAGARSRPASASRRSSPSAILYDIPVAAGPETGRRRAPRGAPFGTTEREPCG